MYQRILDAFFARRRHAPPSSNSGREIPLRVSNGTPLTNPQSGLPFISNSIRTTRYTLCDFLPKQVFYQFSRLANFYFLCIAMLQFVPDLSTVGNSTLLPPLITFVSITIAKEGYDDLKRHRLDKVENGRPATVLRPPGDPSSPRSQTRSSGVELETLNCEAGDYGFEWKSTQWQHLMVGDIIKLSRDDDVPADIVLLHAAGDVAYVETMALDGETNLKTKHPPSSLKVCGSLSGIARCRATFNVEDPHPNLHRFEGQVVMDGKATPLSDLEVVYRGSTLRNTGLAIGLVINTGEETKIRMNANRHPQAKKSALELFVNKAVIFMAALVLTASAFGLLAYSLWRSPNEEKAWYMYGKKVPFQNIFLGFIILLNSVVPLSLIMGLEAIRLNQMNSINRDLQLYHAPTDTPTCCNTNTIIDDLGQIGYIFTDKTGTLTENDMKMRKLNIAGTTWLHRMPEDKSAVEQTTDQLLEWTRLNPGSPLAEKAVQFLLCLAICHTAHPETRCERLAFQVSSPDELALVEAAHELGFSPVERSARSITIQMWDARGPVRQNYEILDILKFNSHRKRMSIIVRCPDGRVLLICKGADSMLLPRLAVPAATDDEHGQGVVPRERFHSLEGVRIGDEAQAQRNCFAALDAYAREGLRTLVFGQRYLSEQEYQRWKARLHEAQISPVDRQQRVDAVSEEVEHSLQLVGASAIEDRLQDGVPEAIERLRKANIKIWMLTGDKRETAINIAHSAKICGPSSAVYVLDLEKGALETQCDEILSLLRPDKESSPHVVLVVDGATLHTLYEQNDSGGRVQKLFYDIIPAVQSVICCRASPSQKALLVESIKARKPAKARFSWLLSPHQPLTLAIGDGANDLSMITTAHVGIGISGKEGQQAARIADFSIAQFRFLSRLLLVHGRWNYHRTTRFILGAFWKELMFGVIQSTSQAFFGFTGTSLFDSTAITLYGSLYTSLFTIIAIGSWEQDLKAETLMAVPQLYLYGQKGGGLSPKNFLGWVCHAFITGMLIVCVTYSGYGVPEAMKDNGLYAFGALAFILSATWANVKLMILEFHNKTVVVLSICAATIASIWIFTAVLAGTSKPTSTPYAVRNGLTKTFGRDSSWWVSLIAGFALLATMELILVSVQRWSLARNVRRAISMVEQKSDPIDEDLLAGNGAWHPEIWKQIEQDPDASQRLCLLLPKPETHPAEPSDRKERKTKTRRPADTPWRQQRLWAWRPVVSQKRAIQMSLGIAVVAFALGATLSVVSHQVEQISIDYTHCADTSPVGSNNSFPPEMDTFATIPGRYVSKHFKGKNPDATSPTWAHSFKHVAYSPDTSHNTSICSIQFDIEPSLPPPVFLYYRLDNFYQNHRDYIKSKDRPQLEGDFRSNSTIDGGSCKPLDVDPTTGMAYYPCGLIANSVFNDTFSQPRRLNGAANETYHMRTKGIASSTDMKAFGDTHYTPDQVVPPPAWRVRYPNGYVHGIPDLSQDEAFVLWMRTAALPTFRKLAMKNDNESMPAGRYQIDIEDNYEVSSFKGSKSLVIAKLSGLGGESNALAGVFYLSGALSLHLGILLTLAYVFIKA